MFDAHVARGDIVLEHVAAERDGISPVAEIEAHRVVGIEAECFKHIAALVADAAGNVVSGGRADACLYRAAQMSDLGLVIISAV